ncbi:Starch synthase, catalytic domain-containing protein [Cynara cardunculus var. scolymus]|uniref:starch synthase n=1 Tax=Cynara cardunculus var. scolymus TaxID=59895 RepID=A0A124SFB8_CYNCS|nr:Starch synthase, catalytic domain-containing protein [Cynara cardunculus var. scolymus]
MEVLQRATVPQFTQFSRPKWKPPKHRLVCCFGLESHNSIELHQDRLQSLDDGSERTQNDVWRLFTEAQRNIMYLNKQRVQAIEELEEMKREQKSLLEKIEQLEGQAHASSEEDPSSISSELLLRIDSMVLTGILDTREASGFRGLLTDTKLRVADYFSNMMSKSDSEVLAALRHFSNKRKMKCFHIIHICTEMEPVASVGSLASYVTSLSHVLQKQGNLVEVILPNSCVCLVAMRYSHIQPSISLQQGRKFLTYDIYASLNLEKVKSLREIEAEVFSYFNGQLHRNRIWTGVVNGIGVTFIQPVYYSSFFSNEKIYGYSNDFERFSYFSRASLDYILKSGKQPDVLHIHNWETSIVGPLFWDVFVNQGLAATRILLTCQSFNSQCLEQPDKLAMCGLDPARLHRHDRLQDNNKLHLVNILKAGVVYANKVIVMSSIHSKDQIISTMSHGLEVVLGTHKDKLLIAPFGYDDSNWDPSCDKFLPQSYSADDMGGKAVSKVALQQQLGLPGDVSSILVGCIFSEDSDVDLEILKSLAWDSSRRGVQDRNVRFLDKYDESLSHLIFAGSDIILCTFNDPMVQVPLKAIKHFIDPNSQRTRLSEYIINTFANVPLSQALNEIKNKRSQWDEKIKDAMSKDLSWDGECYDVHVSAYTLLKK